VKSKRLVLAFINALNNRDWGNLHKLLERGVSLNDDGMGGGLIGSTEVVSYFRSQAAFLSPRISDCTILELREGLVEIRYRLTTRRWNRKEIVVQSGGMVRIVHDQIVAVDMRYGQ
jgi:hypothetical protein